MQKKLIAVAVIGALGAPAVALAQTATISVTGRAYFEYGYVNQGANAAGTTNRTNVDFMQTPGSNISFQGEEKLGGNMSAWFKCESTADFRGQSQNGFCGRNSAVGLKGNFGNVFMGVWDTPFKNVQDPVGGGDTGFWGTAQILTGDSTTVSDGASPQVFKRRQRNSVNYHSPVFSGFQVMAATSSVNSASAVTQSAANNKPRVWSLAAKYGNGPLNIYGAYERHNEFYSNAVSGAAGTVSTAGVAVAGTTAVVPTWAGDERGWVFGANYTFGGNIKVGGLYTRQSWDSAPGVEGKVNAWHLGVDWKIAGPHGLRFAYTKAGDVKGTSAAAVERPAAGVDTGVRSYQARYNYAFSKRTDVGVGFHHLKNDRNAAYQIFGPESNGNGHKGKAYAMYIDHRF